MDFVNAALAISLRVMEYTSKTVRANDFLMRNVIERCPYYLRYASDTLKNDSDFVLMLLKKNERCFPDISNSLKANRSFILKAVALNGELFNLLPDRFKKDEEMVLVAREQRISARRLMYEKRFMHAKLKNNPAFQEALTKKTSELLVKVSSGGPEASSAALSFSS